MSKQIRYILTANGFEFEAHIEDSIVREIRSRIYDPMTIGLLLQRLGEYCATQSCNPSRVVIYTKCRHAVGIIEYDQDMTPRQPINSDMRKIVNRVRM